MKKLIYPCIIMMVFSFLSCEQETIDTPDNNIANLQNSITNQNRTTDAEILENSLQWASYTVAEVLLENTEFESYFNSKINGNKTVSLNSLLNDSSFLGIGFRNTFENTLLASISGIGHPEGQQGRPRLPIGGSDSNSTSQQQTLDYLDYILNNNCIEIYIPYNLVFTKNIIYTTGHPLDNDNFNSGIKLTRERVDIVVFENIDYLAPSMGMMRNNIILARPVRIFPSVLTACLYSDYSGIDFTTFFN